MQNQYDVTEVAQELRVGKQKVLEWISEGQLKAANMNNGGGRPRWLVSAEWLNDFLESRTNVKTTTTQPKSAAAPKPRAFDEVSYV